MKQRIASEAKFRQRVLKYAAKHSVTRTANRYRISRQVIYK